MEKEALVIFRCPPDVKHELKLFACQKRMSLTDFLKTCIGKAYPELAKLVQTEKN